jgi:hypothetical protein
MAYFFPPVGRCIYCGETEGRLSDEHIIPFGLGGTDILPASSCSKCAKITGKFEGTVQRTLFGDMRVKYNFPTRRKKDRPKTKSIKTNAGTEIEIPVANYPTTLFVYHFGACGFLLDAPPHLDVMRSNASTIHNKDDLNEFIRRHDWNGELTHTFRFNEFRRMLAKIAHSFLTAIAGYGSFFPLALGAILNDDFNLSYLVGENAEIEPVVKFGSNFMVRMRTLHQGARSVLIVEIRLFHGMQTPTYHVVTGETHSPEQFAIMMENIHNSGRIEVLDAGLQSVPSGLIAGVKPL